MIIGRFILRFLLVPLGACFAMCAAMLMLIFSYWNAFLAVAHADPELQQNYFMALFFAGPELMLILAYSASMMMLPAAIGVIVAETFAIRSWIYHALNGGLAAWIGWYAISNMREEYQFLTNPTVVIAAGIAAGFAYWLVAGWSAGFWKPVFAPPPPVAPPPSALESGDVVGRGDGARPAHRQ